MCLSLVIEIIVYVLVIQQQTLDTISDTLLGALVIFIFIGAVAYTFAVIGLTIKVVKGRENKKNNLFLFFVKFIVVFAFLPLFLLLYILQPAKFIKKLKQGGIRGVAYLFKPNVLGKRLVAIFFVLFFILSVWVSGYFTTGFLIGDQLGYIAKDVPIVGTGSMYPTWDKGTKGKSNKELAEEIVSSAGFLPYPNGIVINGKRWFGHTLGRGDIIIWRNQATFDLTSQDGSEPAGLIKRIIGMPGDTIELRNGIVYLNKKPQKEPYTAKPYSTFGEKFLKECQVVTVPKDTVFAMGDNRKGSADSREIGFTPIKDIELVIPLEKQKGTLDARWRDTSKDLIDSGKPTVDTQKFLNLLNRKRKEQGVSPLTYNSDLELSAKLRGKALLQYDDFDQEHYTMEQSMEDAGYWNTVWWELPIQGYYDAEELIEDYLERDSTDNKNIWFDPEFDDIGIAEVQGILNGCPTQVIMVHVAGYTPPNYKAADIESWRSYLVRLQEIQPGWSSLKNEGEFYEKNKVDIDRINEIIQLRIANISAIVRRMESNQWLNPSEERYIDQDVSLSEEQNRLADKLNSF